jgi:hypothetical protein
MIRVPDFTESDAVYFNVDGRTYELDLAADRMSGDELLEIEDRTGLTLQEWTTRMIDPSRLLVKDILLLAYLAERRVNPMVRWDPLVRELHPLTFKWGKGADWKDQEESGTSDEETPPARRARAKKTA